MRRVVNVVFAEGAELKAKLDEQLAVGEELGALIWGKLEGVVVDG